MPILSNIGVGYENRDKTIWKVIKYNIILNAGISFLLAIVISCFSGFILRFYGNDFLDILPLIILAFSTIFTSVASVVGSVIASRSKMWIGFVFNAFWAFMMISLSRLFLINGFGATSLALATLISYAIHVTLQLLYLYYSSPLHKINYLKHV